MSTTEEFNNQIENYHLKILNHQELAVVCGVDSDLFDRAEKHFDIISAISSEIVKSKDNYKNQILNDYLSILDSLGSELGIPINNIEEEQIPFIQSHYNEILANLEQALQKAEFNLGLFTKFSFFDKNIVAIGANGSGKSSLSQKLKEYLPDSAMTISAQKLLIIPVFKHITNPDDTKKKLKEAQSLDKTTKFSFDITSSHSPETNQIRNEFSLLLDNLLSENNTLNNKYVQSVRKGGNCDIPESRLINAITIWNSLIEHRTLVCDDGINILLTDGTSKGNYPAYQMSDGEKVVLYYIAHVLQAPKDGFIIVDEPEMYLHKTLLNKLWDILETEREDCIFIYLTHDLEFATSRNTAKKVWIQSFTYPDKWEFDDIPTNDLPEALLLKLLGSRKRILFCEGESGSIDDKIYNLLLPDFTITPVSSCSDVINYTKAFNTLPNSTTEAFGLIDSDHQDPDRLASLKDKNIFALEVSEVENLLFDEEFLRALSNQMMCDDKIIDYIKSDILQRLSEKKDLQVANYLSAKINYYFKDSHVSKGNSLADVMKNYDDFNSSINIEEWHNIRSDQIQSIIESQNYESALLVLNDKGLKTIANRHFNIGNFQEKAINFLQFNSDSHQFLLKHFPEELTQHT